MKSLFLHILPKTLISRVFGVLAEIFIPKFLREFFFSTYSKIYKVNLDEVRNPLVEYPTFSSFFTRDLCEGARPIAEEYFVSPVDGFCVEEGQISDGLLIQAKGIAYSVSSLFNESSLDGRFVNGDYFWTLYLAPGDYHHIHSPCDGLVNARLYVPGSLYPVNNFTRKIIPNLYSRNERVILNMSTPYGEVGVAFIGAMNVGSIGLSFENDFRANVFNSELKSNLRNFEEGIPVKKGGRLGTFYLGSTIILFAKKEMLSSVLQVNGRSLKFGEALGSL